MIDVHIIFTNQQGDSITFTMEEARWLLNDLFRLEFPVLPPRPRKEIDSNTIFSPMSIEI